MMRIVIFGGGFVGQTIAEAARFRGLDICVTRAPRLRTSAEGYERCVEASSPEIDKAIEQCYGADVVINAAGLAAASSSRWPDLISSNSALPGLLGRAASAACVPKFIHVSSAAVQGRVECLTAAPAERGFSPYSWSKILGERMALKYGPETTIVHRPAGVHGIERRITQQIARFAASRFATVAGSGDRPTPQALAENVGDAIAFLAMVPNRPPRITTQPWEGLTTSRLLAALGGRSPRGVPPVLVKGLVSGMAAVARPTSLQAYSRRVELLLLGQSQQISWLTSQGWLPPKNVEEWYLLGRRLRGLISG